MKSGYGAARAWAAAVALSLGVVVVVAGAPAMADATRQFSKFTPDSGKVIDHSVWDKLLKLYVVHDQSGLNRVRYNAFKAEGHAELKRYLAALEKVRPAMLARPEQFAYWANLYNAKTIDIVLDAYPVKSIRDISIKGGFVDFLKSSIGKGGPWKAKVLEVEGIELSLDDVEHGIMRPIFKDPRVHYAVNCASVGCPNLQQSAFTGAKLEAMLDAGAKAFINSPRGFKLEDGQVTASSIYSWFVADFGGNTGAVLQHAARYAEPELNAGLLAAGTIKSYGYDWSLNDAR